MLLDMQDVGEEGGLLVTLHGQGSHVVDLGPFSAALDHASEQAQVLGTHQLRGLSHTALDCREEIALDQVQVASLARSHNKEFKRTSRAGTVDRVVFVTNEQHAVVHEREPLICCELFRVFVDASETLLFAVVIGLVQARRIKRVDLFANIGALQESLVAFAQLDECLREQLAALKIT